MAHSTFDKCWGVYKYTWFFTQVIGIPVSAMAVRRYLYPEESTRELVVEEMSFENINEYYP